MFWVGSSLKDLRALGEEVKDRIGQDLFEVQMGGTPASAKPLTGFGAQVLEIVVDHNTNTFRAVYTVRYADRVYVLHVFQKKSKKGRALPREAKERIENAADVGCDARSGTEEEAMKATTKKVSARDEKAEITESSGNVFADLGLPNPEERLVKAQLALEIKRIIQAKAWNQTQAAAHAGIDQAKVSALLRGKLKGFSTDRLLRILNNLGRQVEVRISAREYEPDQARTSVAITR